MHFVTTSRWSLVVTVSGCHTHNSGCCQNDVSRQHWQGRTDRFSPVPRIKLTAMYSKTPEQTFSTEFRIPTMRFCGLTNHDVLTALSKTNIVSPRLNMHTEKYFKVIQYWNTWWLKSPRLSIHPYTRCIGVSTRNAAIHSGPWNGTRGPGKVYRKWFAVNIDSDSLVTYYRPVHTSAV